MGYTERYRCNGGCPPLVFSSGVGAFGSTSVGATIALGLGAVTTDNPLKWLT